MASQTENKYFNIILCGIDKTISVNPITKSFFDSNPKKENTAFFVCYRMENENANKFIHDLINIGSYTMDLQTIKEGVTQWK